MKDSALLPRVTIQIRHLVSLCVLEKKMGVIHQPATSFIEEY